MTNTFTQYGRAFTLAALLALPAAGFAQANQSASLQQGLEFLNARRAKLGLTEADVRNPALVSEYTDSHNGVKHIYLRQRHQGVEIHGALLEVHLDRQGRVLTSKSTFVPNAAAQANSPAPGLSPEQAVGAAARTVQMPAPERLQRVKDGSPVEGITFSEAGISLEPIAVKLVYLPRPDGTLALAWNVRLYTLDAEHFWEVRVDATTGALLGREDHVISEKAAFAAVALRRNALNATAAAALRGTTPTSPTTGSRTNVPNSYRVWPLTIESPNHGSRELVTNPANSVASPFGWHDTNGVAGAEFTNTRGNNVFAYEDRRARNTAGYSPDGGAQQIFDFTYSATATPVANQDAAITSLFYWNNLMHDVMERHGFTEAARNFQTRNYSGNGLGNDAVRAEAQDGSGMDNANFSSGIEGGPSPRMQMFLWESAASTGLTLTLPNGTTVGPIDILPGTFGRQLTDLGSVSGQIVFAGDACSNPLPNAAAVNGKIALVRRGNCSFGLKVNHAQAAGAKLVIVMDSLASPSPLVSMGGSSPDTVGIRIPSVFISKADGDQIRAALATGTVSGTASAVNRDGTIDNGIVAHEYGHGISNRLTGTGAGCLDRTVSREQMGEGWSDFFALWMTTKPGDVGTTPRGIGTYAVSEPITGLGIRSKPYSTDLSINSLTYADLGTSNYGSLPSGDPNVHGIGEIWAATLWDLNWALINRFGYNADLYAATGGNNIALRLVVDGLKYQGCNPGFIDGRNGILEADTANFNGAYSNIIWQIFSRRGMGASAVQGSAGNLNDQTAAFDVPRRVALATKAKLATDALAVYPNPAQDRVKVRLMADSQQPVKVELVNSIGQVVLHETAAAARLQGEGLELSTAQLPAGIYVVRVTGSAGSTSQRLVVRH